MNNSNKDKIPSPEEKFSSQELRVASNSSRFNTVQEAVVQAEERGEISKTVPRAVLSEDGLYNLLDRLQDLLGQMATLASFVRVS